MCVFRPVSEPSAGAPPGGLSLCVSGESEPLSELSEVSAGQPAQPAGPNLPEPQVTPTHTHTQSQDPVGCLLIGNSVLVCVSCSRNQLSVLPAVICSLPLKVLIACNNKLVSLPEELGQLRHLTELVSVHAQGQRS